MKREKYEPVLKNISYFIKWAEGAIVIGIVSGCIGTAFGKCVLWVSAFFQSHPWMVFLLPLSGLLVLGVYHALGEDNNRGTNMVIESIYSNTEISFATAPAVFAGTLLTHLGGGSAGREGAALQMGGSIGDPPVGYGGVHDPAVKDVPGFQVRRIFGFSCHLSVSINTFHLLPYNIHYSIFLLVFFAKRYTGMFRIVLTQTKKELTT